MYDDIDKITILKKLINLTMHKKITWIAENKYKYGTTFEKLTFIIKKYTTREYYSSDPLSFDSSFELIVSNNVHSINAEFAQQEIEDFCMAHDLFTLASKKTDVPLHKTLRKFINETD